MMRGELIDPTTGKPPIQDWEYWFRCYCNAMDQVEYCLTHHLHTPNDVRRAHGLGNYSD